MKSLKRYSRFMIVALIIFCGLSIRAQMPAPANNGTFVLKGGVVVTVSGETIQQGSVVVEDGKIIAVGADVTIPEGAEIIDVNGQYIYPAMIHARSSLGLTEIGRVSETVDLNETGSVNPNVRIQVAYNSASEHIPLVRTHGIAITVATPMGGVISGLSAAMLTDGWTWEDMTYQAPIAMIVNWPDMQNSRQRDRGLKELQNAFDSARRYHLARKAASKDGLPQHNIDVRWEAMIPVLEGETPVHIYANELTQIQAAINWAEKENLNMVLVGARDAAYVASQLKAKNIPVIISPVIGGPTRSWEAYDERYRLPSLLHQAGITFCIAGEASAANVIRLPNHAASAVAFGLPEEEALKSLTLYPAQILGLDHRMGSVEVGKDASLIVAEGNLLELTTQISQVYIQGRKIDMVDKHRRQYDLYNSKYHQIGR